MTNLEKIRQMSVGELKAFIKKDSVCYHRSAEECNRYDNCDECLIDWLEEEELSDD